MHNLSKPAEGATSRSNALGTPTRIPENPNPLTYATLGPSKIQARVPSGTSRGHSHYQQKGDGKTRRVSESGLGPRGPLGPLQAAFVLQGLCPALRGKPQPLREP